MFQIDRYLEIPLNGLSKIIRSALRPRGTVLHRLRILSTSVVVRIHDAGRLMSLLNGKLLGIHAAIELIGVDELCFFATRNLKANRSLVF